MNIYNYPYWLELPVNASYGVFQKSSVASRHVYKYLNVFFPKAINKNIYLFHIYDFLRIAFKKKSAFDTLIFRVNNIIE